MKILIIGAGAIGIALGASLSSVGENVAFVASKETKAAIDKGGVKRTGLFGDCEATADDVKAYLTYDEIDEQFDYIIVSSKTYANKQISQSLSLHKNIFAENGKIVILQNGIGNDEPFCERFDRSLVYNARVITGFERYERNASKVTVHNAPILLGSLFGYDKNAMAPLCDAMNRSGIPTELCDEVGKALWAKLLYNTTLNPLGAILNSSYGELYESEYARNIMERMVKESYDVMNAAGESTYQADADSYIDELYGKLIPNTYSHRSSTLQDIEKKQKTEIDTLNGSIVRLGKRYGVPMPTHEMICLLIKAIEDKF